MTNQPDLLEALNRSIKSARADREARNRGDQELRDAVLRDITRAAPPGQRELDRLIPDTNPDMPHAPGGLHPSIRGAVERITGKPVQAREGVAPNPAGARATLRRWAVRQVL